MSVKNRVVAQIFLCLLLAVACDRGQPAAPQPPRLTDLLIADGNNQSVLPGQAAPRPLTVRAVDQEGRPMAGVKVTFRVASGGGSLSDSTVTTGADGLAQTRLTLGPAAGVNTVMAAVEGLSGLPPTFTVTGLGAPASADTTGGKPPAPTGGPATAVTALSVVPPSLGVRGSGRQEAAVITFEVRDAANLPVADGEAVAFALAPAGSGTLSAARATTAGGRVSVTLRSDTLAAPVRVTATARGITGAASVPILSGPPDRAHFSLAAEKLNVPGGVIAGLTDRITAFVFDQFSNPVPAGTSVSFSTTAGGIEGSALTDAQGRASVNLITAEPLPRDGLATVTARVVGRGDSLISASIRVLFSGPTRLDVQPATLISDTLQSFKYSVRDPNGNPLSEGTKVKVTAQNGQALGDVDVTLPDVQAPGSGRTEFEFLVRRSSSARTEVSVAVTSRNGDVRGTFLVGDAASGGGGRPSSVSVRLKLTSADTSILADGLTTTKVTATIKAEDGTPIRGATVSFLSSAGLIDPSGVTNAAGQATATLTSAASGADLRALVQALADSLRDSVSVKMVGLTLTLSSSPDTIAADGNAQSRIVAALKKTGDIPVSFVRVNFETTLGTLSASSALTDQKGEATAILTSQARAGRATVTASYGAGLVARRQVDFVKGPPKSIVLVSVDPPAVGVRGAGANATSFITFEVRDAQGTPVSDGERIAFSLDPASGGESLNPSESATVNGRVRVAFNSGTVARTVRVIARWTTGRDTVSSTPVPVAIHGGLPDLLHFSLGAKPVNLAGRVVLGLQSTITAYVFDKYSNPVPRGTSIRFRTNGGGIQGSAETNADGQAGVTLFTANPMPPAPAYLATVTGQTVNENGQPIEATTTVLFSGLTVVQLTGAGSDSVRDGRLFIRDGGLQNIQFTVSDTSGNPIMGGSTIKVSSDVAGLSGSIDVVVPDTRTGSTSYVVVVRDPSPAEDPPLSPQRGTVVITVQSLNGNRLLAFSVTVD